jgi:hypothetical protein
MLDALEQQFGKITLWEWVREWIEGEYECEADEHIRLEEYLWLRAENAEEDIE